MKTEASEQITPDQQIQNQSETIKSLERKVESLEKELQKCLDPGSESDTTRTEPSETEKNRKEKQGQHARVYHKAENIISGLFAKNECLEIMERPENEIWFILFDALFNEKALESFWKDKDFRHGIRLIGYTLMDFAQWKNGADNSLRMAANFLVSMEDVEYCDADNYRAILQLSKATKVLSSLPSALGEHDFNEEDLVDLQINFETIASAQKMLLESSYKLFPQS